MRFAAIESWKRYHFQLRGHGEKPVYSNLQHAQSPLRRYAIDWTATILRSSAKTINKKLQRSAGFHYNSSFGVHFVARFGVDQVLDIADDDRLAIVLIAICVNASLTTVP